MKLLNFGSLNIDRVFSVTQIAQPGQTVSATAVAQNPGGKGLNQSLALARAGTPVFHAGNIGTDGLWLRALLEQNAVDCRFVQTLDAGTGSAFIQVENSGQNCIVLDGGANQKNTPAFCRKVLAAFGRGDYLLLQNEINCLDFLIDLAHEKQMHILLNPSPMNGALTACDLSKISLFLLNEDEGRQLTGEAAADAILDAMCSKYPNAATVLTLGGDGCIYRDRNQTLRQNAFHVNAVDTTAAGDTFTGFFLAAYTAGEPIRECLCRASAAAAIAVTRSGAASSIPTLSEVSAFPAAE